MPILSLEEIGQTITQLQSTYQINVAPRSLAWSDFKAAVRANKVLLSIGLLTGLVLAGVPRLFEHWSAHHPIGDFILSLAEHLGVGLIVAAIAVLAYEWVSEARRAQILSWALVELLTSAAHDRLASVHKMLLRDDADRFESLRSLANDTARVREDGDWAKAAYIDFVADLLRAVSSAFHNLTLLSVALKSSPATTIKVDLLLPTHPAKLTDSLLTKLLLRLPAGGKYCAVSNALIWEDLTEFQDSHRAAVANGIEIQRIFVIFQKADAAIGDAKALSNVYDHFRFSQQCTSARSSTNYVAKFITARDYDKRALRLVDHRNFGVFRPMVIDATPIAFDVKADDLSEFEVLGATPTSVFVAEFDNLWKQLPVPSDLTVRYLLRAQRIQRMNAGRYSAVSTFANWADERLEKLHVDSMEAEVRGVQVRRVFVAMDGDRTVDMLNILKEHHRASRNHPLYEWIFCPKAMLPLALTRRIPIPYGIFEDRGKSGPKQVLDEQVLYEAYPGDVEQPFEISGDDAEEMMEAFDKFWIQVIPRREELLIERFGVAEASALVNKL